MLKKTTILSLLCSAFVGGAVCGYGEEYMSSLLLVLLAWNVILAIVWREKYIICLSIVFSIVFLLGYARMLSVSHSVSPSTIDYYNGHTVSISGMVCDMPVMQGTRLEATICAERLFIEDTSVEVQGGIRVMLPLYSSLTYGDILRLQGQLTTPKDYGTFSYRQYLAKDGIYSIMDQPHYMVEKEDAGNPLVGLLFIIRQNIDHNIGKIFPGTQGALLSGLLLGEKKNLSPTMVDHLQDTGLTHIVALSGFNITVIISFLAGFLLKRCRRSVRFVISVLFVVLFAILVGATPSVVRASCMGILGLFALLVGRRSQGLSLLLCTLALLTWWHPLSLILDIGFQLSFLATLGLILISPILQQWTNRIPSLFSLKEVLITTLAAQSMVVPLLLYHFEQLSLVSPLSNLLVLSIIPLTMLIGFLAVIISFIPLIYLVSKVVGFIAWLFLSYIIGVIDLFAVLPFSSVQVTSWGMIATIVYYSVVAVFLITYSLSQREQKNTLTDV